MRKKTKIILAVFAGVLALLGILASAESTYAAPTENFIHSTTTPGCVNVTTKGLLWSSGSGCGGGGGLTSTYVGFGSVTNTVTGSPNLTWDGNTLSITGTTAAYGPNAITLKGNIAFLDDPSVTSDIVSFSGNLRFLTDFQTTIEGGDKLTLFSTCNLFDPCILIQAQANTGLGTLGDIAIMPDHNLGVGTTTPYARLSVVGQTVSAYFTATTSTASRFPYASTTMVTATTASTTNLTVDKVISLPNTTSATVGAINMGGTAVLQNYGSNNLFLGGAGNFTLTGSANMGMGLCAMNNLTGGSNNAAVGVCALGNLAGGSNNAAVGSNALYGLTSGAESVGIGFNAGRAFTTTGDNVCIGQATCYDDNNGVTTPAGLTFAGAIGAYAQVAQSNSLALGGSQAFSKVNVGIGTTTPWATLSVNPIAGNLAPSFAIGSSTATRFVVTSSGNVGVATSSPWRTLAVTGTLAVSSLSAFAIGDSAVCQRANGEITVDTGVSSCIVSTRTAKHDITKAKSDEALARFLKLKPVLFEYDGSNKSDIGLIAEDVATIDWRYAQHDPKTGRPKAINWAAITTDMIAVIQAQQDVYNTISTTTASNSAESYAGLVGLVGLAPLLKRKTKSSLMK